MEAYYAYQGLYNLRLEGSHFVPCITDEEKEEERSRYNNSIRSILSASFRLGSDCHPLFRDKFIKELDEHAGRPIEISLETNPNGTVSTIRNDTNDPTHIHNDNDNDNDDTKRILPPVRRIPFIPHGYQLSVDRRTIRRNPSLAPFHEWLKIQTNAGFITRQETVSMIPPVVLSVEPHHAVLDMCAAPGSKTSQMLEIVSQLPQLNDSNASNNPDILPTEPQGFVVANDSDPKRAYMLINNLRRINSPAAFTGSVDAQFFPQLKGFNNTDGIHEGLFDRVLCDVPCSGDGTMRKNPGIWKNWNPLGSLALHPLQLNITMKGATLTKVGGYICYSTCSMNPIENEAVVAEVLRLSKGSLKLVDKRSDMPGLVARPGWTTWKVMATLKKDKNKMKKNSPKMIQKRKEWEEKQQMQKADETPGATAMTNDINVDGNKQEKDKEDVKNPAIEDETCDAKSETDKGNQPLDNTCSSIQKDNHKENGEEINRPNPLSQPLSWDEESLRTKATSLGILIYDTFEDVPEHMAKRVRKSCFPPTEKELEEFHLERCMRCLPHDMDTGGFFIALFQKTAPVGVKARDKNLKPKSELDDPTNNTPTNPSSSKEGTNDSTDVLDEMDVQANNDDSSSEIDLKSKKGNHDRRNKRGQTRGDVGNSNFVAVSRDIFPSLVQFYGLTASFPQEQIMCRECGDAKILYFITKAIKERLIDRGIQRITVINSGLKVFERNSQECEVRYRVNQEGIHMIVPYMTKRKLVVNFSDFANCLNSGAIYMKTFSDTLMPQLRELSVGSFVVVLEGYENEIDKKMFLVMWRCRGDAVNCLVSQIEIDGVKSKLRAIAELYNIEYDPDSNNKKTEVHPNEDTNPAKKEKLDKENTVDLLNEQSAVFN